MPDSSRRTNFRQRECQKVLVQVGTDNRSIEDLRALRSHFSWLVKYPNMMTQGEGVWWQAVETAQCASEISVERSGSTHKMYWEAIRNVVQDCGLQILVTCLQSMFSLDLNPSFPQSPTCRNLHRLHRRHKPRESRSTRGMRHRERGRKRSASQFDLDVEEKKQWPRHARMKRSVTHVTGFVRAHIWRNSARWTSFRVVDVDGDSSIPIVTARLPPLLYPFAHAWGLMEPFS